MEGFTCTYNKVIKNNNVSRGARLLAIVLNSYCFGDKDTCYPSQKRLGEDLGCSVRTIQRYLKELTEAGIVQIKRSIGYVNTYIVDKVKAIFQKVKDNKNNKSKSNFNNKSKKKELKFNNFDSRDYNYEMLESMALGYEAYDSEKLNNKKAIHLVNE